MTKIQSLSDAVNTYLELKDDLEKIESGQWRDDPELSQMTLQQVDRLREVVKLCEDKGLHLLAKILN